MAADDMAAVATAVDATALNTTASNDLAAGATRPRAGRGRPPAYSRAEGIEARTRQRVLRRARPLFLCRGYADVSVGEIAAAVGVSKPTLYYHFGAKEGLYAAVLIDVLREVGGYIRMVTQAPLPLAERLHQLALGYFRNADTTLEPTLRDADALLGPERSAQVRAVYHDAIVAPIEGLLREGMCRGELRATDTALAARAFLVLLDGFTARGGHTARGDAEHEAMTASLVALYLHGLATPAAGLSVLSS